MSDILPWYLRGSLKVNSQRGTMSTDLYNCLIPYFTYFSVSTVVTRNSEYSYVQHGRVAHRHKFPSCESEFPVGFRDDEAHRALKWDWSSNPVYSPGSIFNTVSL
jgi:hypothetical protein